MSFTPRRIHGTGPTPCDVMLVGEAGGAEEHRLGRPFVGKAGMVLSTYLRAAGIPRPSVHIDNIYPYWTGPSNPEPTPTQLETGGGLLQETMKRVRPRVVGALGRVAAQYFLPGCELKKTHGIPYRLESGLVVVPVFHPAAGFYNPSAAALCQQDLQVLRRVMDGEVEPRVERELPQSKLVEHPSPRSGHPVPRDGDALDTEGSIHQPKMLSWAAPHGSYVSRWSPGLGKPLLPSRLTFHYALHDLRVLRSMGVDTDTLDYDDTIVMAFDLMGGGQDNSGEDRAQPFGLSLKVLAYRDLAVEMQSYQDLVRPYYNKRVQEWLNDLLDCEGLPDKGEPELVPDGKGKLKIYTPQPLKRRALVVLARAAEKSGEPEVAWGKLTEKMRQQGEEVMGSRFPSLSTAIDLVPEQKAVRYAGADAWATRELALVYKQQLRERGLERVYEVDRQALKFVDEFIRNGMPVDRGLVVGLQEELTERRDRISKEMRGQVGRPFNPGSIDDVGEYLYRDLGLVAPRLTKGGEDSTDKKAIQLLRQRVQEMGNQDAIQFLDNLLGYRECDKFLGTYVEWILERVTVGGRLHPDDISATRVVSGRLSGRLLTFPTRSELGAKIRKCFRAPKGRSILSVDLSQIELRMMAEMSGDKAMLGAFERGEDLHALTARKLFKVPAKRDVPKAMRYVAKTLNFAILYGISSRALLEQLAVAGIYTYTRDDCDRFIRDWFEIFGGVREYLQRLWAEAEGTGEVRDWMGRVRYVPNIRLPEGTLKEKARRDVGNFPIQSGARALVKVAEGEMVGWLRANRELVLAILDIHDEVLMEVDEDVVEETGEVVKGHMLREGRERFGVVLEAGVSWGESWGDAH